MLGKLFKHEMKACSRLLLPLYLILVVLTILDRIVLGLNIFHGALGIIPGLITFAYIVAIITMIIVSTVIIIIRFYKNLITDEGYLMFTLPVKTSQLINSKLLAACIWVFGSVVAVVTSLLLVFGTLSSSDVFWNSLKTNWAIFKHKLGDNYSAFLVEAVIGICICLLFSILFFYVSIAIGQLFNGHKILGSVIAYVAIYTILQILSTVVLTFTVYISRKSVNNIGILSQTIMPVTLVISIVFIAVFYWLTDYLFSKKLNLE